MKKDAKIFVAGHRGLVGSALVRTLRRMGYDTVIVRSRQELDLRDRAAVDQFYREECPDVVIDAAAKVGGIKANSTYPVEFLLENLEIQNNVIRGAWEAGVKKLLFLGSSCIYPREAEQPIREDALLSGPLEPTNEAYAIAKIAGIKLCQAYASQYGANFISAMPTNLYGPGDNFDLANSHVLPALLRKFHEAKLRGEKEVEVWGTGKPRREFLHVDDMAEACVFLLENYNGTEIVNVGCGEDLEIGALAKLIAEVTEFQGEIRFNTAMPDGTPRKLLDTSRINALGWKPRISLEDGIRETYAWFVSSMVTP